MGGRRRVIEVPGLEHANPIPTATRIGDLVFSGGIFGVDAATGEVPEDLPSQVEHLFANVARVVEAAGGTLDDVAKLTVWLADPGDRRALNDAWVRTFPDPADRPVRHTTGADLPPPRLVQCELVAVLTPDAAAGRGPART